MESEVREILNQAVNGPDAPDNLVDALRQRFAELGGVDLELPARIAQPRHPQL